MNTDKATTKAMTDRKRSLSSGFPYVYVSYEFDYEAGFLAAIDPVNDELIRTIVADTDAGPMGMNVEETRLYVLSGKGHSVTVFDADTFENLTSFHVGQTSDAYLVAILGSPLGGKAYVANYGENSVVIFNTLTNEIITEVDMGPGKPFALASNKNSKFVYVACKVGDGKDYVVALSLEDDTAYPYGMDLGLTFDVDHNPLTVHPDGHTQITLGTTGMLVHTDNKIGKPVTYSLLDNTVSGIYLDNKVLVCTMEEERNILKQITDLAVDAQGNVTYAKFEDVPSNKGQDKIRVSRTQKYVGITSQPVTTPNAGIQIYNTTVNMLDFFRFHTVSDLAFFSDTKAYVGQKDSIRPIDLANLKILPAIPMNPTGDENVQIRNVISGYSNQSL